jgi:hypothetical protein
MNATSLALGAQSGHRIIREVNDSIYEVLFRFTVEDGEFWCECSEPDCDERVTVTLREYAALRKRDGELLLSRPHAPVRLA